MHVLGFQHEHTRHDRDNHIKIKFSNVRRLYKQHVVLKRKVDPMDLLIPYDLKSITHYPEKAFSKHFSRKTIKSKIRGVKVKFDGLSEIDVWKIKYMYNCLLDSEEDYQDVVNSAEHAEEAARTVSKIESTTVTQQRRHDDDTSTSHRTTIKQLPTIQSTIKQIQNPTSSTSVTITSIETTSKMTTSTTRRPIAILNMEIIDSVEVGNEVKVEELLNEGADVNARIIGEHRNRTLLHIATGKGYENIVSLLLAHDANINDKDASWGEAAIHKAAESGYANIVSLLLYHNASVEMKGEGSKTPLHYAAVGGQVNVVSLLLDKSANIEARNTYNWTPIHFAARHGHANVVSLLLYKGANIEAKDVDDWTPLQCAVQFGHVNVVLLLLDKGANVFAKGRWDNVELTPLDLAKRENEPEIVEILERKTKSTNNSTTITETSIGTMLKMTTSTTRRPIAILNMEIIDSVEVGNEVKVEELLNEGADVNARIIGEHRNRTLLHIATGKGHENIVSLLLAHDANINDKDASWGEAAIHKAAESGYANIVSLLLYHNASVEMKGEGSKTPLHYAAVGGQVNVVSLLLDKSANIEARNTYNWTPIHFAARHGHANVVSLLLYKGANIEAKDVDDWTPLQCAVQFGHVNVVLLLLDKGANVFAKGRWDNVELTPLDLAKRENEPEIVEILERKTKSTNNSTTITETSIGTTLKMTTSTTTIPISILNKGIIKAIRLFFQFGLG